MMEGDMALIELIDENQIPEICDAHIYL